MTLDDEIKGSVSTQKHEVPQGQKSGYLRYLGFGFELGGVVALFAWFGLMADEKFDTKPWFTLTGLFIAFTGMMYQLMKEIARDNGKSDKK